MSDHRLLGDVLAAPSSATTQVAEHELLATISTGSRFAMAELYFLYFARLAAFFVHVTGNTGLVEELTNATMLDVWRQSARIEPDTSVLAWIMSIAYSHGQMRLARAELARPPVLPSEPHTKQEDALTTTSQKRGSLQDLLLALPFEERAVLHLVYSGCHSRQRIADIMNTSAERVDLLLTQARQRLGYSKGVVKTETSRVTSDVALYP